MKSADSTMNLDEELISAGLDQELSEFEQHRLKEKLSSDSELADLWTRHHVVQSVLRKQAPVQAPADFAQSVMTQIEALEKNDAASSEQKTSAGGSGFRHTAGLAVAATVAVVSVLSFQAFQPQTTGISGGEIAANEETVIEKEIVAVSGPSVMEEIISAQNQPMKRLPVRLPGTDLTSLREQSRGQLVQYVDPNVLEVNPYVPQQPELAAQPASAAPYVKLEQTQ